MTLPPPPEPVDVAVLIVSWNTRALLAECLDALAAQETVLPAASLLRPLSVQTIVVDNASSDGSAAMAQARFPQVHVMALDENIGFVRGSNRAYAAAPPAKYVLLLNPDAVLCPGALGAMAAFLDAHPRAGACGPLTLNPDGTLQLSWSRFPSVASELWTGHDRRFAGEARPPDLSLPALRGRADAPCVDWASGACLLVRRAALDGDLGGVLFDPAFQMYSEETDLCRRLWQRGWTTHLVPQAEAVHYYGQSSRQAPARTLRLLYRSKYLFFRKHYGWGRTLLLKLAVAATYGAKWALFAVLGRREQQGRQWAVLQSLGARP